MKQPAQTKLSCKISVKVTPNARADEIRGFTGDVLVVRIKAQPVDGKANDALVRVVAEALGLPRAAVSLDHGATARKKLLAIEGISREDAMARLAP
ncbi:MAG TPA: DUF167 domain-containing protein [Opitutaceae bacterium]|nr:DUF167 domain-containing protein [Opitutaceae bacterium]